MGGFVTTLAYYGAASYASGYVKCISSSAVEEFFGHFGTTEKQQNSFFLVSDTNGTASCTQVAKELLILRLSCTTYERETGCAY